MAHGMPRLDTLRELDAPESYASGFWGLARIAPRAGPAPRALGLRARLAGGGEATCDARRRSRSRAPVAPVSAAAPAVAICMATFEPPAGAARRASSTRSAPRPIEDWICVISDDCSSPERFAELERLVAGDPRFVVSRSPRRLGFYRNFERALALAPAGARHVALADQDDVWHPDKLAVLLGALGERGARLQRRARHPAGRRAGRGDVLGAAREQPRRPDRRCSSRTRSRARRRCSRAGCSTPRCRSRPRSSPTSTTTGSGSARSPGARSPTSTGRSTTTSSTAAPRSATPRPTGCRRCATGSGRCAATRASGSGSGACTTSSTSAACSR